MNLNDFFYLAARYVISRLRHDRFPVQMHIRVIDRCNLHCKYCFGDYPVRNIPAPTKDQLFDLLDGLGKMGTRRVTLTGGEPLLRDDIVEIVLRARRNRIEPSLTTNGLLIDRHQDVLKYLNLLTVSVDGNRKTHDTFRGEGSWDGAIHAVALARSLGTPVQLLCTVSRITSSGLEDVYKIAERYNCGVTFDLMAPLYNTDETWEIRDEAASDKQIRNLLGSLIKNFNPRSVFSSQVLRYILNWPFDYERYRIFRGQVPGNFKPIQCAAGRYFGIVETNGDLYPCCRIGSEYSPTNVYQLGIEEAWRRMSPHNCAACIQIGSNMFNFIFALRPATLYHYFITSIRLPSDKEWKDNINKNCRTQR